MDREHCQYKIFYDYQRSIVNYLTIIIVILCVSECQAESCEYSQWFCKTGNSSGHCISLYEQCEDECYSPLPGSVPGYRWCPESQQCVPHGVKCQVMWGVGCGRSSFFCWRGNVCLPKSLPCNGFCTKHYRLNDSVCYFDSSLVLSAAADGEEMAQQLRHTESGTIAPIITMSLLIFASFMFAIYWRYRHKIHGVIGTLTGTYEPEKPPSLSELEMVDLRDPFVSESKHVKTFCVDDQIDYIYAN